MASDNCTISTPEHLDLIYSSWDSISKSPNSHQPSRVNLDPGELVCTVSFELRLYSRLWIDRKSDRDPGNPYSKPTRRAFGGTSALSIIFRPDSIKNSFSLRWATGVISTIYLPGTVLRALSTGKEWIVALRASASAAEHMLQPSYSVSHGRNR